MRRGGGGVTGVGWGRVGCGLWGLGWGVGRARAMSKATIQRRTPMGSVLVDGRKFAAELLWGACLENLLLRVLSVGLQNVRKNPTERK